MSDFVINNGVLEKYAGKGGDVIIPNGVTSIGEDAFRKCRSLTSITIPNSVTYIGVMAFASCINLTSISIPDSVTTIGEDAFTGCISLTSISIPDSVTSIGENALDGCDSLKEIITGVKLPTNVFGGLSKYMKFRKIIKKRK